MSEREYVMLSYCWKQSREKDIVRNIRYRLWQEGYRVWIDVGKTDGIKDSIYLDMAEAVKHATVVVGCLSKAYEDSKNCERGKLHRRDDNKDHIIPLIMEEGYKLNSWVKTIFGGKHYINFSNVENFEKNVQDLLTKLQKYKTLNPQTDNLIPKDLPSPPPLPSIRNPDPPFTSSDDSPPMQDDRTDNGGTRPMEQSDPIRSDTSYDASSQTPELSDKEFNEMITKVSHWCNKKCRGHLSKMKVVISEFIGKSKIKQTDIQRQDEPKGLINLLTTPGLLTVTVFIEVINLCGIGGVEREMKKEWNLPKFKDVPNKTFSEHRKRLLEFGHIVSIENMMTIGQLMEIQVTKETDPFFLIFELERAGELAEGKKINTFIDKLKEYEMNKEVNALMGLKN